MVFFSHFISDIISSQNPPPPFTAVLKGKGAQWQEIARFARMYATYFYLDPLVL